MSDEPRRIERNWGIPSVRGEWKPSRQDGELAAADVCCPGCACHVKVPAADLDPETGAGGTLKCDCGLSCAVEIVGWKREVKRGTQRPGRPGS